MKNRVLFQLFLILGVLGTSASALASHTGTFGAISYSPSTGRWGSAYGVTLPYASGLANRYCGLWDCQLVAWTSGGCAALATGWNRGYGWRVAFTSWEAANGAVINCSQFTGGCRVATTVCAR